jgi:drug/metabolite transporter (DMT)-like permease
MRKLLRQTWLQVVLLFAALLLVVWFGFHHASSLNFAYILASIAAILCFSAYAVYTFFRTGKFPVRPKWWMDFATDAKYRPKINSKNPHDSLP